MDDDQPRELTAVWIDDPEVLWSLRVEWLDLCERTGADVYMRPTWMQVWWTHFGADAQLACLVLRQGGRLTGLLPFCIRRLWVGPLPMRVARLAGTDPHCIVFRLPLEDGMAAAGLQQALTHLVGPLGCHVISFTPVSDRASHLPILRQIDRTEPGLLLRETPDGRHVIFDLPENFGMWLSGLSKKRRGQHQRDRRALVDAFGMQESVVTPDRATFEAFADFHDRQWQATGRGGHFTDWPGSRAFYADLAELRVCETPERLFQLTGTHGHLSTQFALLSGAVAHWRLPARSLDPAAERLSIGKVGLVQMIECLIGMGIRCIEAGRGDYNYKSWYGGQSVPVHRILVTGAGDAWRLAMLVFWSDMIHLAYYRVWFLKIAPRLRRVTRMRPRPLRGFWIRSRL